MRTTRELVMGLVALTAALLFLHSAHAAAPLAQGQAPGYYRMMPGDFEITALSDGARTTPV